MKFKLYFENLDALRFIAFFMVYISHGFNPILNISYPESYLLNLLDGMGGQGVSVFFVLSGFLITYLILQEIRINGRLDIKAFYIRRTLRIWPLFYIVLFHGFVFYPLINSLFSNDISFCGIPSLNFIFLNNFDVLHQLLNKESCYNSYYTITWSVAIEEQFYLIWPLFFYLFSPKKFIHFFVLILSANLLFRVIYAGNAYISYFHTMGVMGDLALGGLSAYLILNSDQFKLFFEKLENRFRIIIYFFGILVFLHRNYIFSFEYALVLKRLTLTLFYAFLILDQNFSKSTLFKLKKLRFMGYLGKYTYGLYLLHPMAILYVKNVLDKLGVVYQSAVFGAIIVAIFGLMLSFLLSYISYHYFESYFLRLKTRFAYITK